MTEKQIGVIAIGFSMVFINGVIGHMFPPFGILFTPIVLTIASGLVAFGEKGISPILKSIFTFGLISIHDILIKLYAGGAHDSEGQGFGHLFLFIGLIPSFLILLTSISIDKQETLAKKIIASFLFPTLMCGHLYLTSGLGLEANH